jgi:hypothetical protein
MRNIMTVLLITFVLSLLCCSKENDNNTNNYYSFVVQDKIWSNGLLGYNSSTNEYYPVKSDYIKIGYDTIIGDIKWNKIHKSYDENHENWEECGYVREESQKVYYKWENDEPELLYDFTLNTANEIELLSTTYAVDSVKYLTILNNEKRKHIFLSIKNSSSSAYVVWIEGIGSNGGFLENTGNTQTLGGANILLCCMENGIYLYKDSTYDVCYFDSE